MNFSTVKALILKYTFLKSFFLDNMRIKLYLKKKKSWHSPEAILGGTERALATGAEILGAQSFK
jgi:hypothetical protein